VTRRVEVRRSKFALVLVALVVIAGVVLVSACGEAETTTTAAPVTTVTPSTAPAETTSTAAPTTTEAGVPDTGQKFELKFSYQTPTKASLVGAYLQPWTDAITAATGGRVKITHYPENSLVKESQQLDALLSGTSDMALLESEFNPGAFPISEMGSLPMLFPSAEVAAAAYWDIINTYAADEWKDMKVLGVTVIAPAEYAGNKPVHVPADFKGLRMRSGGSMETDIIDALGATPVEIETGDLGVAMERGTADGCFLTWSLMFASGVADVAKHYTKCDLFYRCWVLVMNKKVWDSMPASLQEAIMAQSGQENSVKYTFANSAATQKEFGAISGKAKGSGQTMYVLSDAEREQWKAAVAPVYAKWVKSLGADKPGQEIIDKVKNELIPKYTEMVDKLKPATTETTAAK
jgi:TRAP-type C4-dicarboxylate transport system substrate-binding protein